MGLLHRNPFKDGVQAPGTVERIVVTHTDDSDDDRAARRQDVFLTFAFQDERGVPVLKEHRFLLHFAEIPAPGSPVTVAYFPGSDRHIDFNQTGLPDPNVPRGWSAGVFEIDGGRRARGFLGRRGVNKQLALFQTGRRTTAQVVAVDAGRWSRQAAWKTRLDLLADGQQFTAEAWLPFQCTPEPGDLIEIAVSADGRDVALDTDPRWDGPPGQAIVFRTPADVAAQRPPKQHYWGNRAPWGSQSDLQELMGAALGAVGPSGNGFATFGFTSSAPAAAASASSGPAASASSGPAASPAPPAGPAASLAKLAALLNDGTITLEEFDALQRKILAGQ